MFYPNPDGEYNRSTAQASSGTYSLYLNAHTHNGNHYGPNKLNRDSPYIKTNLKGLF